MPIKPVKEFIPREIPDEIALSLNLYSDTIDECINFGSNIFIWDQSQDWIDATCIQMLLRHFLELIDSISILIRQSCPEPAKLLLRGALESYFSILFILKDNSRKKSIAFIVSDILGGNASIDRMIKTEDERLNNSKDKTRKRFHINDKEWNLEEIKKERSKILESSDEFKEVYALFEKLKKKNNYPKWYQCFGPNSIRDLAVVLNEEDLYLHLYTNLSASIHATDVIAGKGSQNKNDKSHITQIRYWGNTHTVTKHTLHLAITILREYVAIRVPTYSTQFKNWFASMQQEINNITSH